MITFVIIFNPIKELSFTSLTKAPIDAKTLFDYYRILLNRTPASVNNSFHKFVQHYIKSHDKNSLLCETGNFEGYDSLIEMNRDINDSKVRSRQKWKSTRSTRNFK